MLKRSIILLLLLVILKSAGSQVLLPSIGLNSEPGDQDSICTIPVYTGSYANSGISENDTAADFRLYTLNGDSIILSELLSGGKPVLLIAGSYTCPVFRNKVNEINSIHNTYYNDINIVIVYTVEAHPDMDVSPYSGTVWTTSANQNQGILYEQPETYGERKVIVSDMLQSISILPVIVLDGPCNEWWSYYGPAPNNAYLIDTNGIVVSKHAWFDKYPDDMSCDIDLLIGNPPCPPSSVNGIFSWTLSASNIAYGIPGDVLEVKGMIVNNSPGDASITIVRDINVIPPGWESAMCVDVCLPSWTDTTHLVLSSNDTQDFIMYFFTDSIPGSGGTRVRFMNDSVQGNHFQQQFYGNTMITGIDLPASEEIRIFPNPAGDLIRINYKGGMTPNPTVRIFDLEGRIIRERKIELNTEKLDISNLGNGVYLISLIQNGRAVRTTKLIKK